MKRAPAIAVAFMLAASASVLTIASASPAAAQGWRESMPDRMENSGNYSGGNYGDMLGERMGNQGALRERILDRLEERAALRDLLLNRLERRGELRDRILDRLSNQGESAANSLNARTPAKPFAI